MATHAEVFQYLSKANKYAEGCSDARKRSIHIFAGNWRAKRALVFVSIEILGRAVYICIGRNFEISLRLRGIVNGMSAQK